jgi:hypothetical protein
VSSPAPLIGAGSRLREGLQYASVCAVLSAERASRTGRERDVRHEQHEACDRRSPVPDRRPVDPVEVRLDHRIG